MGLSKDQIRQIIAQVELPGVGTLEPALEWVATCDAFTSVKLHLPSELDKPALQAIASRCLDALEAEDPSLQSLIVEFVDRLGGTVHTARLGPQSKNEPKNEPQQESKQAPQQAGTSGDGHKPIGGLRDSTPASQSPSSQAASSEAPTPQGAAGAMPGVAHAVAVGAGKGGVGKSTIAVNLAVALARRKQAVGLMDGDIYGPSLPTLLGLDALEQVVLEGNLQPYMVHGVKSITIGKLVDPDKPLIWRGPMAHGACKQPVEQTAGGELDHLVIDLPPGTGDVPLTMAQMLKLTGAVVVCTPQKVAQDDARRAVRMFQQLGVPVLGVVENMSYFVGDDGKTYDIFGRGGAERMAQQLGVPFLGAVPLTMQLRENSDMGEPLRNFDPATAGGEAVPRAFEELAQNLESQIALSQLSGGARKPELNIS